jgi:hypothetical protein
VEAGRLFMTLGIALFVAGVILHTGAPVPFVGKLPGDLRIERPGFTLYLPLTTSLVLSAALTLAFWLLSKLR